MAYLFAAQPSVSKFDKAVLSSAIIRMLKKDPSTEVDVLAKRLLEDFDELCGEFFLSEPNYQDSFELKVRCEAAKLAVDLRSQILARTS